MKYSTRPFPSVIGPVSVACAWLCLAFPAGAQEEFELQNGRRFPAESVKPSAGGFTATFLEGTAQRTVNFTAKEIVRTSLREPKEVIAARILIASEKPDQALTALEKVEPALLPYQSLPDSWWQRAAILRMDALSVLGKNKQAQAIASPDVLAKLPSEGASLLKDFLQVIAPSEQDPAEKVETLRSISERTIDPWVSARIWLEIGNTLAGHGKIEDAIKAWLRVPVFFPAERDLAVRGTILAARGLQQIQRPQDGLKILNDYIEDNISSPYKETIQTEAAKLDPKSLTVPPTQVPEEDPKEPADTAN
jgi:tetratricopeptide (TPR) repeat protein